MARKRQNNGAVYTLNGVTEIAPNLIFAPRDPINGQDEMEIGTEWINTVTQNYFIKGPGAIWTDLAGGPGNGTYTSITTVGNGLPVPGGAMVALQGSFVALLGDLDIQAGNALAPNGTATALSAVFDSVNAGDGLIAGGSLELQNYPDAVLITQNQGLVDPAQLQGADGQVIIAATSGQPQWATITSTGGSIAFTPGANTLNIERASTEIVDDFDGNSGTATQSSGTIVFAAGTNMVTSALGNTMAVGLLDDITPATSVASFGDAIIATTTVTAGTGLTITANDLDLLAGSLELPSTNLGAGDGAFYKNSQRYIHAQGDDDNFYCGALVANATATGTNNVGIGTILSGADAPFTALTTGSNNVSIGNRSADLLTTGSRSLFLGFRAGTNATTANDNVLCGHIATEIDSFNVVVGPTTGWDHNAAATNVVNIGRSRMGPSVVDNVISINNGSTAPVETAADDLVFIGRNTGTPITRQFWGDAQGIYGVTTDSGTTSTLLVSDQGQLGDMASSRRYKFNIQDLGIDSGGILSLRPVRFNYKLQKDKPVWPGLIAEEVNQKIPSLVNMDEMGEPDNVRYQDLDILMLNELQKLNHKLAALERRYN